MAVVVPARALSDQLWAQLEATRHEVHVDAVVANNGTKARGASLVVPDAVRIVDASSAVGVSHARNAGARAASGEKILFVDDDDIAAPGFVEAMAAALDEYDVVGGALDRRRFLRPDQLPAGAGPAEQLPRLTPGYLPFASGAALGVRREVFDAIGGFDETYVSGGDDTDFCWRAQHAGFTIGFAPDAVMHYRERETLRALAKQHYRFGLQDPHLFRDHRAHGMPRPGLRAVLGSWVSLTLGAPRWWPVAHQRRQWVRSLARRCGRVVGSLRYRTLFL